MLADYGEEIGLEFPQFDRSTLLLRAAHRCNGVNPPVIPPRFGPAQLPSRSFTALAHIDVQAAVLVQDYPAEGLDESKIYYQNDALAFARQPRLLAFRPPYAPQFEGADIETRNS